MNTYKTKYKNIGVVLINEYLTLEFLGDKPLAQAILDNVETMVIDKFKPMFNSMKMKSYRVKNTFS